MRKAVAQVGRRNKNRSKDQPQQPPQQPPLQPVVPQKSPKQQQQQQAARGPPKMTPEEAALTAKNYRLAKELVGTCCVGSSRRDNCSACRERERVLERVLEKEQRSR
jgi:hypothetical protein